MIDKKLGEANIEFPILYLLDKQSRPLLTSELKELFMEFTQPVGINLAPLVNRSDEAVTQIVRNIVSHRNDSRSNMIYRGLINYNGNFLEITDAGREYLEDLTADLYSHSMK